MKISRRHFLHAATAAIASRALAADPPPEPLVGSQLYGWGQYFQREGKSLEAEMDGALSALRDAGYDYAEHSMSANPERNMQFAERLKSKGLRPVSLYTGGAFHEADHAERNVESLIAGARGAKEAGFSIINCNPNPIGRNKTDDELATQARWLGVFGEKLRELGMRLGIHNHTPEMANGAKEFHANFQRTDAGTVGFCYDVHWVFRGGVMPPDALEKYGARIVSWHLRQSREKIWWEDLDSGDVDYEFIARHARAHALAPFYTVELALEAGTKITRSVVENHARSREFVKRVFGA
jgi:inosose dehydratase